MSSELTRVLAPHVLRMKGSVDLLESQMELVEAVLAPLLETRRFERARRIGQLRTAEYVRARDDRSWEDRMTTSRSVKRRETLAHYDDAIARVLQMRDSCTDASARAKFQDEADRLSSIRRSLC